MKQGEISPMTKRQRTYRPPAIRVNRKSADGPDVAKAFPRDDARILDAYTRLALLDVRLALERGAAPTPEMQKEGAPAPSSVANDLCSTTEPEPSDDS